MLSFSIGKLEVKISIWFAAFFAVLALDIDRALLARCVSFIAVHEMGHLLAMGAISELPSEIGFYLGRIEIKRAVGVAHAPFREFCIFAGGIAANLVAYFVFSQIYTKTGNCYELCVMNLTLAAFNALPAANFDGGRMLKLLLGTFLRYDITEKICRSISFVTAVVLLAFGAVGIVQSFNNLTFVVIGVYVIIVTLKNSYD